MTEDRDLKALIRRRAARTGESYQAAHRQVTAKRPPVLSESDRLLVEEYFGNWWEALERFRPTGKPFGQFGGVPVPLAAMQSAALGHPNPKVRRACLGVLDHEANDESMDVFRRCLDDDVARVRLAALHGLSCRRCKTDPDAARSVLSTVLLLARSDRSAKVRQSAVAGLVELTGLDEPEVLDTLQLLAGSDPDPLVRETASDALKGRRGARLARRSVSRRLRQGQPDESRTAE